MRTNPAHWRQIATQVLFERNGCYVEIHGRERQLSEQILRFCFIAAVGLIGVRRWQVVTRVRRAMIVRVERTAVVAYVANAVVVAIELIAVGVAWTVILRIRNVVTVLIERRWKHGDGELTLDEACVRAGERWGVLAHHRPEWADLDAPRIHPHDAGRAGDLCQDGSPRIAAQNLGLWCRWAQVLSDESKR